MRLLLVGATGFLGSAVLAELTAAGHSVVATYHRGGAPAVAAKTEWRRCDLSRMSDDDWLQLVRDVDAVVNCAGLLQDNAWESTSRVHVAGVEALLSACERARLFRFIHFSAVGVDRHQDSNFSRTKQAAERLIVASLLDWVILRPCVIVGAAAFGGSALFRGLAALPVLPVMPDTGPLQVVQRKDVVSTVLHFLSPGSRPRQALDLAGPQRLSLTEIVAAYRGWMGWPPARQLRLPFWSASALYGLGDFARALGWRPPLGSTARREMRHGAVGDPASWKAETGITPLSLEQALARRPASVQERWYARLYLLKPAGFTVFSLFWIATGIVSLTCGFNIGVPLMREGGAGALSGPLVVAGALTDIAIGMAIAVRPTARWGLYGAFGITCFYAAAGTAILPRLWTEPLGPLVKVFPLLVLNLFLLAILDER